MKHRIWIIIGVGCVLLWGMANVLAQRGGRGGGGRGGGGGGRGGGMSRPSGGGMSRPAGGSRPSGANRTPSFSQPSRPSQLPSQSVGGGRPGGLPSGGLRPGSGQRPPIASTLPSTRPDIGGRPGIGVGGGPGRASTLPVGGAGIGAGLGNRVGNRPTTLPGLGDRRPGISQLPANRPIQERRQSLHDRLVGQGRPEQLPARDWGQVRQNWQDGRDQIREDWQNYRDQVRDDWQNWFDDHYSWYGGWYLGHGPGYWYRWDYLWDNYPVAAAIGLTSWAVNSLGSQFGCGDYSNPYYEETMPVSYAEPVVTAPVEPVAPGAELPPGVSKEAVDKFDQARAAFFEGKYDEALKLTDQAVALMPRDAVLHEFRSLVLFALKRYAESAAAINAVLAVGPGWDWKTLSSLYPSVKTYEEQLRALEAAPDSADVRFLLGYHYLTGDYPKEALAQFKRAAEMQPKDKVAAALVATLSPREAGATQVPPGETPKAVSANDVTGTWTATGARTAKYSMDLRQDGTFSWSFTRGSRKQEVKGVYTLEGNVLAMEPDAGGTMLAEIAVKGPDILQFKMIGGAKDDPGLEFRREPSK